MRPIGVQLRWERSQSEHSLLVNCCRAIALGGLGWEHQWGCLELPAEMSLEIRHPVRPDGFLRQGTATAPGCQPEEDWITMLATARVFLTTLPPSLFSAISYLLAFLSRLSLLSISRPCMTFVRWFLMYKTHFTCFAFRILSSLFLFLTKWCRFACFRSYNSCCQKDC